MMNDVLLFSELFIRWEEDRSACLRNWALPPPPLSANCLIESVLRPFWPFFLVLPFQTWTKPKNRNPLESILTMKGLIIQQSRAVEANMSNLSSPSGEASASSNQQPSSASTNPTPVKRKRNLPGNPGYRIGPEWFKHLISFSFVII